MKPFRRRMIPERFTLQNGAIVSPLPVVEIAAASPSLDKSEDGGKQPAARPIRMAVPARETGGESIDFAAVTFVADTAGALYWPQERLLVVADLHLEKGSSFAARGSLLPPYDTPDTLARLGRLITRYAPRAVIALGDNFHDGNGAARLTPTHRAALAALQRGREWIWITGNHDPDPLEGIDGSFADSLAMGPLTFRHRAQADDISGEISGHLHPVAVVVANGRGMRRRCFASDGKRMVMPAFGAYAGGLNVRHRAFVELFGRAFTAHVMGDDRLYAIAAAHCVPD